MKHKIEVTDVVIVDSRNQYCSQIPTYLIQSSTQDSAESGYTNVTKPVTISTMPTCSTHYVREFEQLSVPDIMKSKNDIFSEYKSPLAIYSMASVLSISCSKRARDSDEPPYFLLNSVPNAMDEETFLSENGYTQLFSLQNTLQGELMQATCTKTGENVIIKKTEKPLYYKQITVQNGMNIIVQEDIMKEALILHHLTVDNKAPNGSIAQFIQFLESDDAFYLVMEDAGSVGLSDLINTAHHLIAQKKMRLKHWKKITKYIFWQMAVLIHWLHHDMHCCHLDLVLENIMVLNATFTENKTDGMWCVDPNVKIKLIDFGLAEIFAPNSGFKCIKHGLVDNHYLSAPRVFRGEQYDARKADVWSLGIILFQVSTGLKPYNAQKMNDPGFERIKSSQINELLVFYDKSNHVNGKMVKLMSNILHGRETKRMDSDCILEHEALSLYYKKYKPQIDKKSRLQRLREKVLKPKMDLFPYYR
eukprot:874326_1